MKVNRKSKGHRKGQKASPRKRKNPSVQKTLTKIIKKTSSPKGTVLEIPGEAEAQAINDEHEALTGELSNVAEDFASRAIALGKRLVAIKKSIGHGHWQQWVKKHLKFSISTAKRYISAAKPKRSNMSVLKDMVATSESVAPGNELNRKETRLRLFSTSATKVLNQPVENISAENKGTILAEFERFEPIALQLCPRPSVFAMSWQKKLKEPPVRWTKSEIVLFKEDIANAQEILAAIEADAEFDANGGPEAIRLAPQLPIEGDAP